MNKLALQNQQPFIIGWPRVWQILFTVDGNLWDQYVDQISTQLVFNKYYVMYITSIGLFITSSILNITSIDYVNHT